MSIVHELQQAALDESAPISALLRKTLAVASKLNLQDSVRWAQQELNGYKPEVLETPLPAYRDIPTQLIGHNPYHGWRAVQFENADEADLFSMVRIYSPIAELAKMLEGDSGTVHLSLPPEVWAGLVKGTRSRVEFRRQISKTSIVGILDAVRNLVLQWALKLENDGILGEGHTFSAAEKQKAVGSNVDVPGLTITGSNINVAIQTGTATQTVTSTLAPESKPNSGLLPELMSKVVKAVPDKWIVIALGSAATIGGSAYAWARGWIQTLLQ